MGDINIDKVKLLFLQTIKKGVCDSFEDKLSIDKLNREEEIALLKLSKKHDLAHLVCEGLRFFNCILSDDIKREFESARIAAVMRYEQLIYEYKNITETLKVNKIPFLPLKGAAIRDYYIEPWYRTSCDIDILVKKEDLQKAIKLLCETNAYKADNKLNYHDISLYSQSNIHLELHFSILENRKDIDVLLNKVWDYARLKDGCLYEYRQTNEFLIFHLLAHMLYHFINGGCGVKSIVDFWAVCNKLTIDEKIFSCMLDECGVKTFYESITELTKVWFEGGSHTQRTLKLENYILNGGVYGSLENRMKVVGTNVKNNRNYVLCRIFCPYDVIKNRYPVLKKHKWLLPFYEVVRWIEALFSGKSKKLKREVAIIDADTNKEKEDFKRFLTEIGL